MIGWKELFDVEDSSDLERAIKLIKKMNTEYESLVKNTASLRAQYTKDIKVVVGETEQLAKAISDISPTSKKGREQIESMSTAAEEAAKKYDILNKGLSDTGDELTQLTKDQEAYNKSAEETTKINDERIKLMKKLESLNGEQAKGTAILRLEIQEKNKQLKESAKESLGLITLYQKEAKRLVDLRNEYKDLALQNQANTKEGKALKKTIDDLDKSLKDLDGSVGQNQRHVGDYANQLADMNGASADAVGGLKTLSNGFKALLANPVVAVIAAIVAGLTLLFNAFKKSEEGSRLLSKGMAFLEGIMSFIVSISVTVSEKLKAMWDDPLKSLKEFGDAILTNVVNRFKAIPLLLAAVGKGVKSLASGDLKGLKEAGEDVGQALIQMNTGLDVEQQQAFAKAVTDTVDAVNEQTQAFIDLEAAQRRVAKLNRVREKQAEDLITQEERLKSIRDDSTKSFKEREAAGIAAGEVLEKRSALQVKIAKDNLSLINQEISLRRKNGENVNELLDKQLEAYKAFAGAERDFTLAVRENEKERDMLKQDRLERDLDILLDGFDNQKSINERIIADENRVLEERKALLAETKKLGDDSFNEQINTLQQFTDKKIDANKLLAESDAVVLNEQIRNLGLSEIIEGRLLEVIRDRRTANLDLAEVEKELSKEEIMRINEVKQAELDRAAEKKRILADTAVFGSKLIEESVEADKQAAMKRTEILLKQEGLMADERKKLEQDLQDELDRITQEGVQKRLDSIEKGTDQVLEFGAAVGDLFAAVAERQNQKDEEALIKIEENRERQLAIVGENEEAQAVINKKADKDKEAIEKKQADRARKLAIFNKALSLSQVLIETSLAVAKALANPPGPPFSIPQAVAAGALGAVQAATIIAQPIPAFKTGTNNAPGGLAIVGEEGRELVKMPSGDTFLTGDSAHLIDLPKGSQVLTNAITENILAKEAIEGNNKASENIQKGIREEKMAVMNKGIMQFIQDQNMGVVEGVKEAIKGVEIHQWKLGPKGLSRDIRKGNTVFKDVEEENGF